MDLNTSVCSLRSHLSKQIFFTKLKDPMLDKVSDDNSKYVFEQLQFATIFQLSLDVVISVRACVWVYVFVCDTGLRNCNFIKTIFLTLL